MDEVSGVTAVTLYLPACVGPATYKLEDFYTAVPGEPYPVEAIDLRYLDTRHLRQVVPFSSSYAPGTIVIDLDEKFLYLVQHGRKALRYGVGVGIGEFQYVGTVTVARKAKWPTWTPTSDMLKREPRRYSKWASGMPAGPMNPLGARALYLYKDGKDTLLRIHGTTEPWSIGKESSSGCVRMINQDVIDLYERVEEGTQVVFVDRLAP
jgi:Uncharacterized protein conserved in bacteria